MLKVYDLLGSMVDEIVNAESNAGFHKVEFDASNLASGIYIYSMETNNYNDSKKMLLMK